MCDCDGLHHRLSAQRWGDGMNMWPNTVLTLNHLLGVQIVCLVIARFLEKLIKKCLTIQKY